MADSLILLNDMCGFPISISMALFYFFSPTWHQWLPALSWVRPLFSDAWMLMHHFSPSRVLSHPSMAISFSGVTECLSEWVGDKSLGGEQNKVQGCPKLCHEMLRNTFQFKPLTRQDMGACGATFHVNILGNSVVVLLSHGLLKKGAYSLYCKGDAFSLCEREL